MAARLGRLRRLGLALGLALGRVVAAQPNPCAQLEAAEHVRRVQKALLRTRPGR